MRGDIVLACAHLKSLINIHSVCQITWGRVFFGVVRVNLPAIRTTNGWVEKYDTKWADKWLDYAGSCDQIRRELSGNK